LLFLVTIEIDICVLSSSLSIVRLLANHNQFITMSYAYTYNPRTKHYRIYETKEIENFDTLSFDKNTTPYNLYVWKNPIDGSNFEKVQILSLASWWNIIDLHYS